MDGKSRILYFCCCRSIFFSLNIHSVMSHITEIKWVANSISFWLRSLVSTSQASDRTNCTWERDKMCVSCHVSCFLFDINVVVHNRTGTHSLSLLFFFISLFSLLLSNDIQLFTRAFPCVRIDLLRWLYILSFNAAEDKCFLTENIFHVCHSVKRVAEAVCLH